MERVVLPGRARERAAPRDLPEPAAPAARLERAREAAEVRPVSMAGPEAVARRE
jgi:hypothetical protein